MCAVRERERDRGGERETDRTTFILPLDTRHTNLFVFINRFFLHLPGIMNKLQELEKGKKKEGQLGRLAEKALTYYDLLAFSRREN